MGYYDDRDYRCDQDRRYEETRQYHRDCDHRRDLRDREFYRDDDRRYEASREDREFERRRREEASDRGWRAVRDGNLTEAIRNFAGPDAALRFMHMQDRASRSEGCQRQLVPHAFVGEPQELEVNVQGVPAGTQFEVSRIDGDGDAVVRASHGGHSEIFWVRRSLVGRLGPATPGSQSFRALVLKIFWARLTQP